MVSLYLTIGLCVLLLQLKFIERMLLKAEPRCSIKMPIEQAVQIKPVELCRGCGRGSRHKEKRPRPRQSTAANRRRAR